MAPRVYLVDAHPFVRRALRMLLEQVGMDVVGEAADAEEALRRAGGLRPAVVVLDIARPVARCLSVAHEIVRTMPGTNVILVAFEDYLVAHAFQAGIRGYVLKTSIAEDLPMAIQHVASGGIYLSPGIQAGIFGLDRNTANDLVPAP